MESETGVGRRRAGGVDADEEVVGARGGDRVQRVPGHQWWVVRILNLWWRGFSIFGGKYRKYLVKSEARS